MTAGMERHNARRCWPWFTAALALLSFSMVFGLRVFRASAFWLAMSIAVGVLNYVAWRSNPARLAALRADVNRHAAWKIVAGILTAGLLYFLFVGGRKLAIVLLPRAPSDIEAVYALKGTLPRILLAIGLTWIAAGEELFWRHYLQHAFETQFGPTSALVLQAVIYAVAHTASRNLTLMAAALVAGLFWGTLYRVAHSPVANMISHLVWGWLIFLAWPLS